MRVCVYIYIYIYIYMYTCMAVSTRSARPTEREAGNPGAREFNLNQHIFLFHYFVPTICCV